MMNKEESSLTAGKNGPVLLQDVQLIQKLTRFVRERIPERVVFAKGTGAHGYFRVYMPMSDFTKAAFLQSPDKKTPVFVRFSTMTGSKGSADTLRDVRGFAVKFYTTEGNYDLISTNLPVFFIRDAIHFPELMHALKPSPSTNLTEPARFWKYISETPEATHMAAWLFSDHGTIKSYRHMEGYSVNHLCLGNCRWSKKTREVSLETNSGSQNDNQTGGRVFSGVSIRMLRPEIYVIPLIEVKQRNTN